MKSIDEQIEEIILNTTKDAIEKSKSYSEAILYVNKMSSMNEIGQKIKKAIQGRIKELALNSKIDMNGEKL